MKIEEIKKLTGYIRVGCSPVGDEKPILPSSMLQLRASSLSQSVEAGSAPQVTLSLADLAAISRATFSDVII